ncbi:guanine-1-methyltransferase-domain-containing protein [Ephemerocybe angulata]|uniref:tRNA (guanine(9)-N1)-methyltransferase n=1 Tax=Ephemerocybe angulata TaxID=980116 RepID=A0A8H6IAQ9_9AGAR|nr:guanine-1-methyltransferase-domain-containing protein [Tulosesus angulatus]
MNASDQPAISQAASPTPGPTDQPPALPPTDTTPALSKKAAKRAAKEQRYAANKLERRAREKEAKKAKKRIQAEKRAAGELDEDGDDQEQARKQKRRKLEFGARVVVDLGFDDLMSPKEVKSLTSQLAYTYSSNKHASFPFELLFTSLNGQTKERMESLGDSGHIRWTKTEWWQEGFERLWSGHSAADQNPSADAPSTANPGPADAIRQKVVYLTADSEEELTVLSPDETYIIGGIVDHNRYKNLCLNKAKEHGIRTAKLPIGSYLASMPTRKVLTVNQCFEILIKWVETRDWEESLYSVIPQRKFAGAGKPILVGGSLVEPAEKDDDFEGEELDGTVEGEPVAELEKEEMGGNDSSQC